MDPEQEEWTPRDDASIVHLLSCPPALSLLRRTYLFTYNLLQFLGFSWICGTLSAHLLLHGTESLHDSFSSCWKVMYSCQILTVVEVINAALGVVHAGVFPVLIQVMGRNVVLFVVFGGLRPMQRRPVMFSVFYLWSVLGIIRYLSYMLACVGARWRCLTRLRDAVWLPLYSLSALAEAVAVVQSLVVLDGTEPATVPLPAALGSVSLSFSLKLYLLLMVLGLSINLRHLLLKKTIKTD